MKVNFKVEDMTKKDFEDMEFDLDNTEKVLKSSGWKAAYALADSFNWIEENDFFWNYEYYRLNLGDQLSNNARAILESWVEQYKTLKINVDFKVNGMTKEDFREMEFNLIHISNVLKLRGVWASKELKNAFCWKENNSFFWTYEYYRLVVGKLLTDEAREIIDGWIKQYKALEVKDTQ